MRITRLETIRLGRHPHSLWLRIHTDDGLTGLGETSYAPRAVSALIHDQLAPLLLEQDPLDIERHWHTMFAAVNAYGFGGAETRAISAVDIALWDIAGQYSGQPIYNLLGGRSRDRIPIYNTCLSHGPNQDARTWMEGRAGQLAADLLQQGISAMKIWPFDRFALANHGQTISFAEIEEGLRPWKQVRDAVGLEMDIILEGHGYWALQPARRIAEALEPYKPVLLEDLMKPDNPRTLAKLRSSTRTPICASELLMNRYAVEEMIRADACDVVMTDVTWAGGITECRKTADMAETNNMGVIFHDCTGPVTLAASLHLAAHATNTWMQEIVRAFTLGFYTELVDHPFVVENGRMQPPQRPGLGAALRPEALERDDCQITVLN